MSQTALPHKQFFNKRLTAPRNIQGYLEICIRSLKKTYIRSLERRHGSNWIVSWSEFARSIGKIQQRAICLFYRS